MEAAKNLSSESKWFVRGLVPKTPAGQGAEAQARDFKLDNLIDRSGEAGAGGRAKFVPDHIANSREGVRELLHESLEKARREAEAIKQKAEEDGRAQGHAEGFALGEREAREAFRPVVESFEKAVRELAGFRGAMYGKVEREMVAMVVALAKKVIRFELSTREDSIQDMIRLAVQSVLDKESMVIKVNPEDKEHAEAFRPELAHLYPEIQKVVIEAQSGIARGGLVIETNFGSVDARIEKLEEGLDKILHLAPPEGDGPA